MGRVGFGFRVAGHYSALKSGVFIWLLHVTCNRLVLKWKLGVLSLTKIGLAYIPEKVVIASNGTHVHREQL